MPESRWVIGLAALDFSNYIAVNRTLIKKYGLIEAVLLGEIASEARYWLQRGELEDGWFYSTVENIESATGLNDYHQRGALKRLQEIGLVEIAYKGLPRKRYIRLDAEMLLQAMEKDNEQPPTESTSSGLNSQQLEVELVNVNNNNQQQQPTTEDIPYDEVVSYLNDRTGKRFRVVEPTKKLIRSRWHEGYSLDDFKHVIDAKCSEWLGTDMERYIRPSTLFAPSHFEGYLNQSIVKGSANGIIDGLRDYDF